MYKCCEIFSTIAAVTAIATFDLGNDFCQWITLLPVFESRHAVNNHRRLMIQLNLYSCARIMLPLGLVASAPSIASRSIFTFIYYHNFFPQFSFKMVAILIFRPVQITLIKMNIF